jgi:hypothetical protein
MKKMTKLRLIRILWASLLILIVFCPDSGIFAQSQNKVRQAALPLSSTINCPEVFFEQIGDLPGDCISSLPQDISADGARVVLMSSADEPDIPNDGGTCDPYAGWPHSNEAAGWTRPCTNFPFFIPPANRTGGLIGLSFLSVRSGNGGKDYHRIFKYPESICHPLPWRKGSLLG